MNWTVELDNGLKQGFEEGLSASIIAERLGNGLTRNAVLGRAFRLGLGPKKVTTTLNTRSPQKTRGPKRQVLRERIRPDAVVDHIMDYKDMGLTWSEIGEIYGKSTATVRGWAIEYGGYQPTSLRFFTAEDDLYLIKAWEDHVPVDEIADKLGRSFGVIRQRILLLQREKKIAHRDSSKTRLLRRFGERAMEAGSTPSEALHKIAQAKVAAFAVAQQAARDAKTHYRKVAIGKMHDNINAGANRDRAIFQARAEGVKLDELAKEFDITRERVRQICNKVAEEIALETLLGKQDQ